MHGEAEGALNIGCIQGDDNDAMQSFSKFGMTLDDILDGMDEDAEED